MTKYQLAKLIEQRAGELKKDAWSFHKQMTIHYEYFKKEELEEILKRLDDKLIKQWYKEHPNDLPF